MSIDYSWNFGQGNDDVVITDGSTFATNSFGSRGTYQVNVTAANRLTSKENTTIINIQQDIIGLTIIQGRPVRGADVPCPVNETCSFAFSLAQGTDMICKINYGDETPDMELGSYEVSSNLTSSSNDQNHIYATAGV